MATERTPTTEQERVLRHVTEGRNVVVHAPPGTGKTFCLLEATRRVLVASDVAQVFIGAYNTELAAEQQGASCSTEGRFPANQKKNKSARKQTSNECFRSRCRELDVSMSMRRIADR